MFLHYLKIAVRNITKSKVQSIIVILSIALGMVFSSLTFMWIRYERKYDSFHRDVDDIYLILRKDPKLAGTDYRAYTCYPEAEYLSGRYPQIEEFTRCQYQAFYYTVFKEGKEAAKLVGLNVDENFRKFFDVKVLEGDPIMNLSKNEAALTRTQADILFEGGDAIGKPLFIDQGVFYIKSVIEDPMGPTSFPYDFLTGYDVERYNTRGIISSHLLVRVNKNNVQQLAREIECDTAVFNHTQTFDGGFTVNWTESYEFNYKLLPIEKVREEGVMEREAVKLNVKLQYVYILMLLGLVLTVCSLTNYFTLFVTKMKMRVREISLRYANGAGMGQIVMLFSTEIMIVLLLSVAVGAVICTFTLPYYRTLCLIDKATVPLIFSYCISAIVIGIISALIAAVFIALTGRRQLARYFGNTSNNNGTAIGYKVSICFQLTVSICAIFCSVIISRQLNYLLQSSDMGYRKHNTGYVYQFGMTETDVIAAREKLKMMPQIDRIVYGFHPTNSYNRYSNINIDSIGNEQNDIHIVIIKSNRDYLDLIEVTPVAGELFDQEEPENVILINETLANMFGGPDEIVGKNIYSFGHPSKVKGVIKDLCNMDPKQKTAPLVFEFSKEGNETGINVDSYFFFSYKEGVKWNELERKITDIMTEIRPDATYHLTNMELDYMEYIKSESMLGKLLRMITIICMIVAISGLYSIVSLLCQKRRKEIAIRKISGAGMTDILNLFLKEYLPIILFSAIAAFSIGTAIMHRWLSVYVRQTPMTVWVYLSVLLCMLLIIGITVFGNIRRAMIENPADVIKSE